MATGGEALICVSLQYNGKVVLKPYAFSIKDPNMNFIQLIDQLSADSRFDVDKQRFSHAVEVTDQTKARVFCGKEMDACNIEVILITI